MPLKYWDEAFRAATFLINRTPSKVIEFATPFECLFHTRPEYTSMRVFGCACWPNLRPYNSRKLQFRSKECVFLGYSNIHKGFKCLDLSSGCVYISRDVVFDEDVFPFSKLHSNTGARLRSEILLLPPTLLNPSTGAEQLIDHMSHTHTTDPTTEDVQEQQQNPRDISPALLPLHQQIMAPLHTTMVHLRALSPVLIHLPRETI